MVTNARPRVWPVLFLLTAIMLVHPPSARADRIDITDPTVLGPVLLSDEIYDDWFGYQRAVAEVRYAGGIYSYIYAVSSSPIFPFTFCCEAFIVSFAVTGHPLEGTWGAINSSDVFWADPDSTPILPTTKTVASVTPLYDGFLVVPEPSPGSYTVVYMQSLLPPSRDGILTYTGRVRDYDHDPEGIVRTESFQRDDAFVPVPEPGTIGLVGLGLSGLAAKLRASRHRRVARPR